MVAGILDLHPQVVIQANTDFFKRDEKYKLGVEWYLTQMPLVRPNQIIIENTYDYLIESRVPSRILLTNPNARFIVVVCHPLKRIIMDYAHIRDFEARNPSGYHFQETDYSLEDLLIHNNTIRYSYPGLYRSKYSTFIKMWHDHYSLDRFYTIDSDDLLRKNPIAELKNLQTFLGVDEHYQGVDFVYNITDFTWCHVKMNCTQLRRETANVTENTRTAISAYMRNYNNELFDIIGLQFDWE